MRKILLGSILAITSIASISFADLIGFNGVYEFDIGEQTQVGNYIYQFDQYGNVSTDNGTLGGNVAITTWNNGPDYIYAFGRIDGKLYGYAHNTATQYTQEGIVQGFVSNFSISDSFVGCYEGSYSLNNDDLLNEIGSIQKVYFTANPNGLYRNTNITIGFYDGTHYYCTAFNLADGGPAGLTGSLGFDWTNYQNVVEYNWGPSPLMPKTPDGKPDTEGVCITVEQLLVQYATNNYNTGLCYSSERYLTATGFVQTTPKFIMDLYPTYTELRQSRNEYQNYCQPPATMETCQQAFTGREDEYTLISKIPQGTDLTVLYDMCNIYQTRSGDMQKNFCDMTEEERQQLRPSQMTTEGYAERIAKNQTTTTTPSSGTVYDELTDQTNRDILEAIPRVYTKITGIFKARGGYDGIIPNYITRLILVIVLFKLFKK